MKLSARNVIKGRIVGIDRGATTAIIQLEIGGGATITSSITNAALDELALSEGKDAYAVVKASDVMIAID